MRPAISAIAIPALACALGARGPATLDDKPSMSRLADLGLEPTQGAPPETLDALVRSEHAQWGPVVKAAGAKAN